MIFGLKAVDDNLLKIDEDMIMVLADKIITERMEVLENKMTRGFDAKLKILMEEQYHNKEKNRSPGGNNSETKQWHYKITKYGRNVKLTTTGDNGTE
jgi:hypothetical protein